MDISKKQVSPPHSQLLKVSSWLKWNLKNQPIFAMILPASSHPVKHKLFYLHLWKFTNLRNWNANKNKLEIQYLQTAALWRSQAQEKPRVSDEYSQTRSMSSIKAGWDSIVSASAFVEMSDVQRKNKATADSAIVLASFSNPYAWGRRKHRKHCWQFHCIILRMLFLAFL